MIFGSEQLLQQVMSDFLQQPNYATSKEQILQRVTCDLTSKKQPKNIQIMINNKMLKVLNL